MTLDRKPLCRACGAHPEATHDCPDCGVLVKGLNSYPCLDCSIKRSNVSKQVGVQHLFTQNSVRDLHAEFTRWANNTGRQSKLAAGAARYLQFLAKLDIAIQRRGEPLSEALIVEVFTTEELRQMGLLSQHLAESGLLHDNGLERRRRSEKRLLESKRRSIQNQAWNQDIEIFERELAMRAPAISIRTIRAYVHAAISLLTLAQVAGASQVTQKALDKLVSKKPGLRASVHAFVSHLNHHHDLQLKITPKYIKPIPAVRQAKYVRVLLDGIDSAQSKPTRLALVAKLLSKLLKTPLEQILQLRHSHLDLEHFRRVKLHGTWIELPQRLHPMLAELPSSRWCDGSDSDPLLFEGRMLMDSLSTSGVGGHVKPVLQARLGSLGR